MLTAQPMPEESATSRRIVLVDDNVDGANALRFLLEKDGHRVEIATNGRSGLELARRIAPDVLVVDIGMPDLSGYDVASAVRADPAIAATCIIAVTGGWRDDPQRVEQARFDHYLRKPIDYAVLQRLIGRPKLTA